MQNARFRDSRQVPQKKIIDIKILQKRSYESKNLSIMEIMKTFNMIVKPHFIK